MSGEKDDEGGESQKAREVFTRIQDLENEERLGLQARLDVAANLIKLIELSLYASLLASVEHDLGKERADYYVLRFVLLSEAALEGFAGN